MQRALVILLFVSCGGSAAPRAGHDAGLGVPDGTVRALPPSDGSDGAWNAAGDASDAPRGPLELHFIDVGQGDSVVIRTPDGVTAVIDAGNNGRGDDVVQYLRGLGVTTIDYAVASHFHSDHIGGMDEVLAAFHDGLRAIYDRGGDYNSDDFRLYDAEAGPLRRTLATGDAIDFGAEVHAQVLHGDTGDPANENLNSVVLLLSYGSLRVLLGGDCEIACEDTIDPGPVDIYKVHHHGSSTSSTPRLLNEIRPRLAVIQVGQPNAYGHPAAETLAALTRRGAEVKRNDVDGTVVVTSRDGATFDVASATGP